ncbi:MAG: hypothetical protein LBT30_00165 [Clostridiales bacterium]|jgi:hypothetical protein|nr:hypothetical protein [Clostridiales bacterium]
MDSLKENKRIVLQSKEKILSERNVLLDNVKGLIIVLFLFSQIFIQATNYFELLPDWFVHSYHMNDATGIVRNASGIPFLNFNFLDLGPVTFFFVIGIIVMTSFGKREAQYGKVAYKNFFLRNLSIVGLFGLILFIGNKIGGFSWSWNTIMSVGMTGVFLVPFMLPSIRNNTWIRLACGAGILLLYHFFNTSSAFQVLFAEEGGVSACFGYLGIVLLATVIGDMMRKGVFSYAIATLILIGVAALIRYTFGGAAYYRQYNLSYLIMALAIVNAIYFVLYVLNKLLLKDRPIPVLVTFGRNFFLFIILSLLASTPILLFQKTLFFQNTEGLLTVFFVALAAFGWLTVPLANNKILFKL